MKCYICDKEIYEKEIVFNKDIQGIDACFACLDVISDASYVKEVFDEFPDSFDDQFILPLDYDTDEECFDYCEKELEE